MCQPTYIFVHADHNLPSTCLLFFPLPFPIRAELEQHNPQFQQTPSLALSKTKHSVNLSPMLHTSLDLWESTDTIRAVRLMFQEMLFLLIIQWVDKENALEDGG